MPGEAGLRMMTTCLAIIDQSKRDNQTTNRKACACTDKQCFLPPLEPALTDSLVKGGRNGSGHTVAEPREGMDDFSLRPSIALEKKQTYLTRLMRNNNINIEQAFR